MLRTGSTRYFRVFLIFIVHGFLACAWAHDLSLTRVVIVKEKSQTKVEVYTPLSRLIHTDSLGVHPTAAQIDLAIRRRLELWSDGERFRPTHANLQVDTQNDMIAWQAFCVPNLRDWELKQRFYADDSKSYTLLRIQDNEKNAQEWMIDSSRTSWSSAGLSTSPINTIGVFLRTGVQHILSGPDHILFVLGLIMLGGTLKSLIKIITAFTVAHSITLSLAVTGLIHPNPRVVEPLIALSIIAVATENLRSGGKPKPNDFRAYIAFGFGLIHGFGFADALTGIGLRGRELATGLVSFNLGVETGQASIICLMLPIIGWCARRWVTQVPKALQIGSVLIGMIGSYWFVDRLLHA